MVCASILARWQQGDNKLLGAECKPPCPSRTNPSALPWQAEHDRQGGTVVWPSVKEALRRFWWVAQTSSCGKVSFPLYWYGNDEGFGGLFADADVKQDGHIRHDAITDDALEVFRAAYPNAFGDGKGRTIEQAKADACHQRLPAATNDLT